MAGAVYKPELDAGHQRLQALKAIVTPSIYFFIGALMVGRPIVLGYIVKVWQLPAIYLAGAVQLLAIAGWIWSVRGRLNGTV